MFCTSLRRRSFDFVSILPKLTSPSALGLRENDLATHDIALYVGPKTGTNPRQLRVLLLSPSSVSESKIKPTIERIRHLTHLTGGQDMATIFLISPPAGARFASARTLIASSEDHDTSGMLSFCKLQAELNSHSDLHASIIPLPTLDTLPALLQSHLSVIASPMRMQAPVTTPFQLLQHCTVTQPLSQQTAFLLSDCFDGVRELAEGCCLVLNSAPDLNSSSSFADQASGMTKEEQVRQTLKKLRDLIDAKDWEDLVVFWEKEWAVD